MSLPIRRRRGYHTDGVSLVRCSATSLRNNGGVPMGFFKRLFSFASKNSEIEELRKRAGAFEKEYPKTTPDEQLRVAYDSYERAYKIFINELDRNTATPQSTLTRMEGALTAAVTSAQGNALLFHKCL